MRIIKEKDEFIANVKADIKLRKTLLNIYYNIFLPTLQAFDGKVYNIRFINALRAECKKISNLIYVSEWKNGSILIEMRKDAYNYNDKQTLVINFDLTNEGRISYDVVTNAKNHKEFIESFIKTTEESYQQTIKGYKKFMKVAERLDKVIKEYNELPYVFRKNFDRNYFYVY